MEVAGLLVIIPREIQAQALTGASINPYKLFISFPVAISSRTLHKEFVCKEDEYWVTCGVRVGIILIRSLEMCWFNVPASADVVLIDGGNDIDFRAVIF